MTGTELLTKAVAALRSGDYTQTRGSLRDLSGHCCLGVICDVSGLHEWGKRGKGGKRYPYGRATSLLPLTVEMASGLTRAQVMALMDMNDAGDRSFDEIADYIEKDILGSTA